jgi:carboxyl-terminal processing protease
MNRLVNLGRGTLKGLILDLRDNPGGLFDQAIKVANLFLSSGMITSLRGRNSLYNREFRADPVRTLPAMPIVVLVNHGTASASEVLAGALQRKPQVILMGERTFGKASVQAVFPLGRGHALRVTTAHYYTAEGADLEGKGLQPDIQVEEANHGPAEGKVNPLRGERPETDNAIRMALDYLLGSSSRHGRPFASWY